MFSVYGDFKNILVLFKYIKKHNMKVLIKLPSVELRLGTNFPLQSLTMKLDFPTAASPANTILYMRSGSLDTLVAAAT